jgi:hypothetical protein
MRKIKSGALVRGTYGPCPSAVAGYDAPDIRQPDPRTFEFIPMVQAMEYAEQFLRVVHVKPYTVVLDKKEEFVFPLGAADLDFRTGTSARKF